MIDKAKVLSKVRELELLGEKLSEGIFSGSKLSIFRGRGLEFDDLREYVHGDDVRDIDWKVSARQGKPFIKTYREEKNRDIIFMVDMSKSMMDKEKIEAAALAIASTSLAAVKNGDRVGLLIFTDIVEKYIPPKAGKLQAMSLLDAVLSFDNWGQTNISSALKYLAKVHKDKGILVILSDFLDRDFENDLKMLRRKFKIYPFQLYKQREKDLPKGYSFFVKGRENGRECYLSNVNISNRKEGFLDMDVEGDVVYQLASIIRRAR